MEIVKVDSSMLYSVGYDPKTKELEVVFNSSGIYRYEGVPRKVYKELLKAESKGRYMRANIIDVYPYHQVFRRR